MATEKLSDKTQELEGAHRTGVDKSRQYPMEKVPILLSA
jgi:hypothetical protein